jgi:hypothetical protein
VKAREANAGRQNGAGKKRSQVDIVSEAGKCINVKKSKARIGLAVKQASKQNNSGQSQPAGSKAGKSRQAGGGRMQKQVVWQISR